MLLWSKFGPESAREVHWDRASMFPLRGFPHSKTHARGREVICLRDPSRSYWICISIRKPLISPVPRPDTGTREKTVDKESAYGLLRSDRRFAGQERPQYGCLFTSTLKHNRLPPRRAYQNGQQANGHPASKTVFLFVAVAGSGRSLGHPPARPAGQQCLRNGANVSRLFLI